MCLLGSPHGCFIAILLLDTRLFHCHTVMRQMVIALQTAISLPHGYLVHSHVTAGLLNGSMVTSWTLCENTGNLSTVFYIKNCVSTRFAVHSYCVVHGHCVARLLRTRLLHCTRLLRCRTVIRLHGYCIAHMPAPLQHAWRLPGRNTARPGDHC